MKKFTRKRSRRATRKRNRRAAGVPPAPSHGRNREANTRFRTRRATQAAKRNRDRLASMIKKSNSKTYRRAHRGAQDEYNRLRIREKMLNNPQRWRPRPNIIVSHVRKGSPIRIPRVSISRRRTPPPIPRKKGKSRRRSANKIPGPPRRTDEYGYRI